MYVYVSDSEINVNVVGMEIEIIQISADKDEKILDYYTAVDN